MQMLAEAFHELKIFLGSPFDYQFYSTKKLFTLLLQDKLSIIIEDFFQFMIFVESSNQPVQSTPHDLQLICCSAENTNFNFSKLVETALICNSLTVPSV